MSGARHWDQDKEATVYIGNLDERVSDKLVWELMLQAGRIVNVHLPKDRVLQNHQGYGFVEFISEEDADYASKIMNGIRLFGKPIRVNKASADKQRQLDVGAELFIGNLDQMVTESVLFDTFSRFGPLAADPKIARDENGMSKGYGFVSFSTFDASDDAIAKMHGNFLMNREINVQYAYKKDGQGKRHGDEAERMLASQAQKNNVAPPLSALVPTQPASAGPGSASQPGSHNHLHSNGPQSGGGGQGMSIPPTGPAGMVGHQHPLSSHHFPQHHFQPGHAGAGGMMMGSQPGQYPPIGLIGHHPPGRGPSHGQHIPPTGPRPTHDQMGAPPSLPPGFGAPPPGFGAAVPGFGPPPGFAGSSLPPPPPGFQSVPGMGRR